MNDSTPTPNPFTAAKKVAVVQVTLTPHDVVDSSGLRLDAQTAARLLDRHAKTIAARMIAAGIETAAVFASAREETIT